jgi:GT2 family glycosyltransferase
MPEGFEPQVHTFVPYHPLRPVDCLIRALDSLKTATKLDHRVEVAIQGPLPLGVELPPPEAFPFQLIYFPLVRNRGNAVPANDSVSHFLSSPAKWWARLQDDIILPNRAWDTLIDLISWEKEKGEHKVGYAQIRTAKGNYWMRPWQFERALIGGSSVIRLREAYYAKRKGVLKHDKKVSWHVAGCTGFGSSVYHRKVFEAGCAPDRRYFVGLIDTDLAYQIHQAGYKSALTWEPMCEHTHQRCLGKGDKGKNYQRVRYGQDIIRASRRKWLNKWGSDFSFECALTGQGDWYGKSL